MPVLRPAPRPPSLRTTSNRFSLRSPCFSSLLPDSLLEGEDPLPVALHADDKPALLRRLVVQPLSEGADLGVRQPLGRAIGVLACAVVVQDEHREPPAVACLRVLQHLPVAGRVAERGVGTAP